MAPRFSRRRRRNQDDAGTGVASDGPARLDADEHAWWARRDVDRAWTPRRRALDAEPERDVLAEHFGEDWRTSFGAEPPTPVEPAPIDPYELLEVDPDAAWEDIVKARRRLVRRHHPDRLAGLPDDERLAAEDRMRAINAAYAELKVRRGR